MDKNLEEIQDELKVLKNELKETLVDIRDHLLTTAQNPFHSGAPARGTKDSSPVKEDEPEETVKVSKVALNRPTSAELQAPAPTMAPSPMPPAAAPGANGGGQWPAQFGGGQNFPGSPQSLFPPLQTNAASVPAFAPQSGPMPGPADVPAEKPVERAIDKVQKREKTERPAKVNGFRKTTLPKKEMFLPEEDEDDEDLDGDMDTEDEDKMSMSNHNGHNGKNGKATDALSETEIVASASKEKPQSQATDLVTVAMLAPWLDTSLQKIGKDRLIAVVSMYSSMGGISNELKDVIVQLIQLDGGDAAKTDVPLRDSLRVLAELDDLLQRGRLDVTGAALLSVYLNGKASANHNGKARPRNL